MNRKLEREFLHPFLQGVVDAVGLSKHCMKLHCVVSETCCLGKLEQLIHTPAYRYIHYALHDRLESATKEMSSSVDWLILSFYIQAIEKFRWFGGNERREGWRRRLTPSGSCLLLLPRCHSMAENNHEKIGRGTSPPTSNGMATLQAPSRRRTNRPFHRLPVLPQEWRLFPERNFHQHVTV